MKVKDVAKLSPLERFLYWIRERHAIYLRRQAGEPKPWTDDEILQRYRFCNVRRMDDRVSQWLLHNWYEPYYSHKNMLIACCLARQFNNVEALEAIGFPDQWQPERVESVLKERAENGLTNFNSAYMITGTYGGSKITQVIQRFIHPLYSDRITVDTTTMRAAWKQVLGHPGYRSFIAGQVVADLRWAVEGKWKDRHRWAPMGPGSIRGMHRLHDRWIAKAITEEEFLDELRDVIHVGEAELSASITSRMEAMDWQNCLCEVDKYTRTVLGEGRPKRLFKSIR